jgi:anti-sigma B factor antagonist
VGSVDVLTFPPRADATFASEARTELQDLVDAGRVRFAFDLSGVTFVDSSGLSVLVTALKKTRASGGDVALVGLTPPVRSLIELTRLQSSFWMFDDLDAAIAQLAGT